MAQQKVQVPEKSRLGVDKNSDNTAGELTLQKLKDAIPSSCFEPSVPISLAYVLRDFVYASVLIFLALRIDRLPANLQILAWLAYGFVQGCVGTGIWILGHECGHGSFSRYGLLNDVMGWFLHSILLVPFFSWKITHARHHRYTAHIEKDTAFVPETEAEHNTRLKTSMFSKLLDFSEDTPLATTLRLLVHQLFGWQLYLLFNVTAGKKSLPETTQKSTVTHSHFDPTSNLFLPSQRILVLISDIGLLLVLSGLYLASQSLGYKTVFLLYFMPYFWVHHWLVAITYLHHTHPTIPHYKKEAWGYMKGALCTVDRSFGFIGRHFFHEIIDFHVVHHLFPKIPFYKAEEATRAIQPLLGTQYREEKKVSFWFSLFDTFRRCGYISQSSIDDPSGVLWWALRAEKN